MSDRLIHLVNKGRGEILFVTLGGADGKSAYTLANKLISPEVFAESLLKANTEVMTFKMKGLLDFMTDEDYIAQEDDLKRAAQSIANQEAAKHSSVESALASDNPQSAELDRRLDAVRSSVKKLEEFVVQNLKALPPVKSFYTGHKEDAEPAEKLSADDGLDLPLKPPPLLQPQPRTKEYLAKAVVDKKDFLKTCRDISLLRDIAMFEADEKLKGTARRAAKKAEKVALSASDVQGN